MRILVAGGSYGRHNKGDDAILLGMLATLRRVAPGAQVGAVLPRRTPGIPEDVRSFPFGARGILAGIRWSDAVLVGGGNILFDGSRAWAGFPRHPILVMTAARAMRRPYVVYAAGAEPIGTPMHRRALRSLLQAAAAVSVRDSRSAGNLRGLGVTRPIDVVPDPAYALASLARGRGAPGGHVVVNVMNEPGLMQGGGVDALAAALGRLVDRTGWEVVLLPHDVRPNADVVALRALQARLGRADKVRLLDAAPMSPEDIADLVARAQLVLSMRMHVCIFAAVNAVPFVPILWERNRTKILALSEKFGSPLLHARELDEGSVEAVLEATRADAERRARIGEEIARTAREQEAWETRLRGILSGLGGRGA